jgi:medium-chain acyl-[acyl-carrier-protein] hydrolase
MTLRAADGSNPWIACRQPDGPAALRLFCFPYAGGGAAVFRGWPELLPAEVEVCAVQLPGRETRFRDPPLTRLALVVERLAEALGPHLDLPFAFFGHSMGALIGFELSRALRGGGLPAPAHLFVSGFRAPQLPDRDPPIHHLPDAEFVAELRALSGTPEEVFQNPELVRLMLPTLRADFQVCETYAYQEQEPLGCPISVFGGLHDSRIDREELEAWQVQTRDSFALRMFQGNHFYMNSAREPLVRAMLGALAPIIRRQHESG